MAVWVRVIFAILTVVAAAILMLGPFPNPRDLVGLDDRPAHAIAFGLMTAVALIAAPRVTRLYCAVIVFLISGTIEIAQVFTGRSASISDLAANLIGISLVTFAWTPRVRSNTRDN